ncbi:unnamed protein product [Caenorhabditis brenneri]
MFGSLFSKLKWPALFSSPTNESSSHADSTDLQSSDIDNSQSVKQHTSQKHRNTAPIGGLLQGTSQTVWNSVDINSNSFRNKRKTTQSLTPSSPLSSLRSAKRRKTEQNVKSESHVDERANQEEKNGRGSAEHEKESGNDGGFFNKFQFFGMKALSAVFSTLTLHDKPSSNFSLDDFSLTDDMSSNAASTSISTNPSSQSSSRTATSSSRSPKTNVVSSSQSGSPVSSNNYIIHSDPLKKATNAPAVIVLCSNANDVSPMVDKNRVKIVKEYEWQIPEVCIFSREGSRNGFFEWPATVKYPVRVKKYTNRQYGQLQYSRKIWTVQTIFSIPHNPDRVLVTYEGYTTVLHQNRSELMRDAPEAFSIHEDREAFLIAMARSGPKNFRKSAKEHRTLVDSEGNHLFGKGDEVFWLREEIAYFHTVLHKQYGLGPIFYMSLGGEMEPPFYIYSPTNILHNTTLSRCLERPENKTFEELLKVRQTIKKNKRTLAKDGELIIIGGNHCQKGDQCKCDRRFELLYGQEKCCLLKPNAEGLLDFIDFNLSLRRIVVECSDACGCEADCPRRQLQKGQQKPLHICYENQDKGWGVRAGAAFKAGEFICEYTGQAFYEPKKSDTRGKDDIRPARKGTAYEAGFDVMDNKFILCAEKCGNVARFINHKCRPNAIFIETFSRKLESDPLVPRIAVYAFKDIPIGEEITLSYYGDVEYVQVLEPSNIECRCGSGEGCIKYLPARWEHKET